MKGRMARGARRLFGVAAAPVAADVPGPEKQLWDLLLQDVTADNSDRLRARLKGNQEAVHSRKPTRLGNGATLIMVAMAEGSGNCVRTLMELGADPLMRGCWFVADDDLDAFEVAVALRGFDWALLKVLLDLTAARDKREATEADVFSLQQHASLQPVRFHPEMRIKRVACGYCCSALLTDGGHVYTWGENTVGKLGHPNKTSSTGPRRVFGDLTHRTAIDLAVGKDHMICLDDMGKAFGWGANKNQQLGFVQTGDQFIYCETPQEITSLRGLRIVAVAAGELHSLFLESNGHLLATGLALQGRLGAVPMALTNMYRGMPVRVPFAHADMRTATTKPGTYVFASDLVAMNDLSTQLRIVQISCGKSHSAVLDEYGSVWTFGVDTDGRCGQPVKAKPARTDKLQTAGDLAAVHFPHKIVDLTDVSFVTCGARCTYCVMRNGSVVSFGNGSPDVRSVEASLLTDVRMLSAPSSIDSASMAAVTNSGELFVSGRGMVSCAARLEHVSYADQGVFVVAGRDRSTLGEAFKFMYLAGLFCDVRFVCADGSSQDAHRSIICARLSNASPMRRLLLDPPPDLQRVDGLVVVPLNDVSSEVLNQLLLYLYSDRTLLSVNVQELLSLCEAWKVPALPDQLRGRMMQPSTLAADALSLVRDAELREKTSDYSLMGNDAVSAQPHRCHRAVLAARSEYYRAMLCGGYAETELGHLRMHLEGPLTSSRGGNTDVIWYLLEFLYTNNVTVQDPNDALELLQLANNMQLPRLMLLAEVAIEDHVDASSAAFVWTGARMCNAKHLERYCVDFARTAWDDVASTEFVRQMDADDRELFRLTCGAKK